MPALGSRSGPFVSLLEAALWGEPGVIGRVVRINTYPFTVVGVSAPSFFDLQQSNDPEVRLPGCPWVKI